MSHVTPLDRAELGEFEPVFERVEAAMGFVPNSMLTMARRPELLRGFAALAGSILGPESELDPELRQMVAYVASHAAGCRYCQAHTSHTASRLGAANDKIEEAFEFETSPRFSAAERAALRLARDAALVPNQATPAHFGELRRHFEDEAIVEIVAVVSLFGFLNRWNDTMATRLEASPKAFAEEHLDASGWQPGKHGVP